MKKGKIDAVIPSYYDWAYSGISVVTGIKFLLEVIFLD